MKGRGALLYAVAVFLVAAVASVLLFVHAGELRQKARDTDCAVLAIQTAIEELKAGGTPPHVVYFDRDFNPVTAPSADGFVRTIEVSGSDVTVAVNRAQDSAELLSFSTTVFRRGDG